MTFDDVLHQMAQIHTKKKQDYTGNAGEFFNFFFAEDLSSRFKDPMERVFATMIGIKLARLIVLQNQPPKNESVIDTMVDLCNYMVLWTAYRTDMIDSPLQTSTVYEEEPPLE
jgi:hypothetical protein